MRITWEIDADDGLDNVEAALEAWRAMREPATTATVFEVQRDGCTPVRVDLREHRTPEQLGMPVWVTVAVRTEGDEDERRAVDATEEHFTDGAITSRVGDRLLLEGTAALLLTIKAPRLRFEEDVRADLAVWLEREPVVEFRWEDDESPAGEEA